MLKKTTPFRWFFILLLAAWPLALALCLAACKREPDLPADPHVPLINPFIGVWKTDMGTSTQYWQFRPDGTGGRAATEAGPFSNNFNFFVYAGQDVQTATSEGSLVMLEDSAGTESVNVTRYEFLIADGHHRTATLTPGGGGGVSVTLDQVSGEPQVLNLTNSLLGEWSAQWDGVNHDGAIATWSFLYRPDGTVKTYHHGLHQFENAYALRGNTLVIFGAWRYSMAPVINEIGPQENGKWEARETQSYPDPTDWVYTKVDAAKWK